MRKRSWNGRLRDRVHERFPHLKDLKYYASSAGIVPSCASRSSSRESANSP
jgi:hypothetical protein